MGDVKLAIPLFGKMATRSFHNALFRKSLSQCGFDPVYFVDSHYLDSGALDLSRYHKLQTEVYDKLLKRSRLLTGLTALRRFAVRTETTDLRFRESIEELLYGTAPVSHAWLYGAGMDLLRRVPRVAGLAAFVENLLFRTHAHDATLQGNGVQAVLTPGMGSYGFWNEGFFAREARRFGLPVFAAITNYDNVVNRGFRGFEPQCLAVWSRQMADETVRLQAMPASRIEITGPAQFDRYFKPLSVSREEFLRAKGLDPSRQTILFAGGWNLTHYYEVYRLLIENGRACRDLQCNFVVRPHPHFKILSAPTWAVLEKWLACAEGVYVSDETEGSFDSVVSADARRDVDPDSDLDELHCLLAYSDVLINVFSTVSLEAAICDLPTIHLGYDAYTGGQRFVSTVAHQQRQTHNLRKLRLAAARVAKDGSDLMRHIDFYLGNRAAEAAERRTYALSECEYLDGRCSARLAQMLHDRLGRR